MIEGVSEGSVFVLEGERHETDSLVLHVVNDVVGYGGRAFVGTRYAKAIVAVRTGDAVSRGSVVAFEDVGALTTAQEGFYPGSGLFGGHKSVNHHFSQS